MSLLNGSLTCWSLLLSDEAQRYSSCVLDWLPSWRRPMLMQARPLLLSALVPSTLHHLCRRPPHVFISMLRAVMRARLSLVALTHRRQGVGVLPHGVRAGVGRGEGVVMLAGGVADSVSGCYAVPRVLRPVPIA